jgi:hypothetical protein
MWNQIMDYDVVTWYPVADDIRICLTVLFTAHYAAMLRLKIKSFLKFVAALHVSAYPAIIRRTEIRRNYCDCRATSIRVFLFAVSPNEVSVVPPPMPHALFFCGTPVASPVCSVMISRGL